MAKSDSVALRWTGYPLDMVAAGLLIMAVYQRTYKIGHYTNAEYT
jgi:hypothetical protein